MKMMTTTMMMMMMIWSVTLSGLVRRYQHFGGKYCLHPQGLNAVYFFETFVSAYKSTWLSNLDHHHHHHHRHVYRHENLKSYISGMFFGGQEYGLPSLCMNE
jgi:hypothetical protein